MVADIGPGAYELDGLPCGIINQPVAVVDPDICVIGAAEAVEEHAIV
jgi:hypothetical protein